jgi:uncharacterized protein YggU (UPF0235/DUF167 family)
LVEDEPIMNHPKQKYDIVDARVRIEAGKTTATKRTEIKAYDSDQMAFVGTGKFEMKPCDIKDLYK